MLDGRGNLFFIWRKEGRVVLGLGNYSWEFKRGFVVEGLGGDLEVVIFGRFGVVWFYFVSL